MAAAQLHEILKPFDLTYARYGLLGSIYFGRHGGQPITEIRARARTHDLAAPALA